MKKIIACNWKDTLTPKSPLPPFIKGASELLKTVEDVAKIYPLYEWIVFPGDALTSTLASSIIPFGNQDFNPNSTLPYCLIGHMSKRLAGIHDDEFKSELMSLPSTVLPIYCIGPTHESDTIETLIHDQIAILDEWPIDRSIIVAYEPHFAIGTGKSMSLEDIHIVYDILANTLHRFPDKRIIYGGSVDDTNITSILEITDGVIIGTASQKKETVLAMGIALGQGE